jgi:hypothetical protein
MDVIIICSIVSEAKHPKLGQASKTVIMGRQEGAYK